MSNLVGYGWVWIMGLDLRGGVVEVGGLWGLL